MVDGKRRKAPEWPRDGRCRGGALGSGRGAARERHRGERQVGRRSLTLRANGAALIREGRWCGDRQLRQRRCGPVLKERLAGSMSTVHSLGARTRGRD